MYGGRCSGDIFFESKTNSGLKYGFIADISPSDITSYDSGTIKKIKILGWDWELTIQNQDQDYSFLSLWHNSQNHPEHDDPEDGDILGSMRYEKVTFQIFDLRVEKESFKTFVNEWNYFAQWVGLKFKD